MLYGQHGGPEDASGIAPPNDNVGRSIIPRTTRIMIIAMIMHSNIIAFGIILYLS